MCPLRIVVDRLDDWRPYSPSEDLVGVDDFLSLDRRHRTSADASQHHATRIINLSSDLDYLGSGYYVSLLAEARGQRVLPAVETLNALSRKALIDLELDTLAPLLGELARDGSLSGDSLTLRVLFGECHEPKLAKLASRLFERLPCPLLEARFHRRHERWRLARLKPLRLRDLGSDEQDLFASALNRHSRQVWRTPKARRRYRYDLAILVDPKEAMPPSNRGALRAFIRAGRRLGIDVSLITRRDAGRLAEFDGLFIRETTALNHHTWRMARLAEHQGLVVIDAPQDILRCTNKVYLHALLRARGVAAPEGRLLKRSDRGRLGERLDTLSFPLVLKIPDGAFSRGVVKVNSVEELEREAARLFAASALLLVQEWLPTDYDWRIGVLDGQVVFASRYYMARGHWQIYDHSGTRVKSGSFTTHDPDEVPPAVLKAALRACRLIGNGFYGVDLKQAGDRTVVIEVNDNPNVDAGIEDALLGRRLYDRIMGVFLSRMEARRQQVGRSAPLSAASAAGPGLTVGDD
ncbi:RimK family protein [Halomonas campisalis]|uniref:RimK family protein n=1 Tax=Billgrantia campisalis TaxID=74661 RepID=A0ABS9PAA8_9GAMM|nr:RimK family protein [Halomonas campisalis]MCG6658696.1 RimK family protein [Halomonas campisalis]MDR5864039.1 RimK family protein [Halomonas campisalis]